MCSISSGLFNLAASTALLTSALTPAESAVSNVIHIESLSQASAKQPQGTLVLFDIDDTIFDSFSMLGSKAWRRYIVGAAKEIDPSTNWHDIFSYELAQKHPLKAVEEITSAFVKDLQNEGHAVCGFTSRERKLWYDMPQEGVDVLTVKQLGSVDVDFNNEALERTFAELAEDPEYFGGIFFANIEPKGNYLLHLFATASHLPKKVIFFDDKLSQVESVDRALTELGIPHECYLYLATDLKGKSFDPLIANIQLYYFYESEGLIILSDTQAAAVAEDNPDRDADYYLRATISAVKSRLQYLDQPDQ